MVIHVRVVMVKDRFSFGLRVTGAVIMTIAIAMDTPIPFIRYQFRALPKREKYLGIVNHVVQH